jgi:hypothetical protein
MAPVVKKGRKMAPMRIIAQAEVELDEKSYPDCEGKV